MSDPHRERISLHSRELQRLFEAFSISTYVGSEQTAADYRRQAHDVLDILFNELQRTMPRANKGDNHQGS